MPPDPNGAFASKADLVAWMKTALKGRPSVNLDVLISETFAFLVSEHGFVEQPAEGVGQFNMTRRKQYLSTKVSVFIWAGGVDNPAFCGIFFENTHTRGRLEFNAVLSKRAPGITLPGCAESTEMAKPHLEAYATALKDHAADLLRGDLSAFEQ